MPPYEVDDPYGKSLIHPLNYCTLPDQLPVEHTGISALVHQPGETHIVTTFALSHAPFNNCHQLEVQWLGVF